MTFETLLLLHSDDKFNFGYVDPMTRWILKNFIVLSCDRLELPGSVLKYQDLLSTDQGPSQN